MNLHSMLLPRATNSSHPGFFDLRFDKQLAISTGNSDCGDPTSNWLQLVSVQSNIGLRSTHSLIYNFSLKEVHGNGASNTNPRFLLQQVQLQQKLFTNMQHILRHVPRFAILNGACSKAHSVLKRIFVDASLEVRL